MNAYVWIFPLRREVVLTDDPSPFAEPTARLAGSFPLANGGGWGEAMPRAQRLAESMGYTIRYQTMIFEEDGESETFDDTIP